MPSSTPAGTPVRAVCLCISCSPRTRLNAIFAPVLVSSRSSRCQWSRLHTPTGDQPSECAWCFGVDVFDVLSTTICPRHILCENSVSCCVQYFESSTASTLSGRLAVADLHVRPFRVGGVICHVESSLPLLVPVGCRALLRRGV